MNRTSKRRAARGYSLAEVMVATAIFTIIVVAALMIYDQSNRVFKRGVETADLQQNVRVAFDKLVADLRMTGYDYDRDGIPTGSAGFVWQASRVYSLGDLVTPTIANGFTYRLNSVNGGGTSCTSNSSPPSWSTTVDQIVSDSQCRWITLAAVNQYQQPDEQIEFAGPTAIAIRGNFDFEMDKTNGNGRESNLESAYFPVVTTGNDEIVIYALRSVSGPNPHSLTFYADTRLNGGGPGRDAYPGGYPEETVTVNNVDLGTVDTSTAGCTTANYPCYRFDNPPYTLYRFTLSPNGTVVETPLASNIRSMNFSYYTNVTGTQVSPEPTLPAGWVSQVRLSDPGGGQYNPSNPDASRTPRLARTLIKSLRVTLIGMAESSESNYDNPLEPATSKANKYRTYRLESLIVPRNLGKQGVREIPPSPPGAPSILSISYGWCGAVRLTWLAPSASSSTGPVESYIIQYNTDNSNVFPYFADAGASTTGYVTGLTPGTTYYFTVMAMNSYGNQVALTSGGAVQKISAIPQNATTPGVPGTPVATGGGGTSPAARPNEIVVSWSAPAANVSPNNMITTRTIGGTVSTAVEPPIAGEFRTYKIYRSTTANFTPIDTGNSGANEISIAAPNSLAMNGNTITFTDHSVLTCVNYYYRVRAIEPCGVTGCASCNVGGATGVSDVAPATASNGSLGVATAAANPSAPTALIALPASECNGATCNIQLQWPKVKTDVATPPNTIYIQRYVITRTRYIGAAVDTDNGPPSGPAVQEVVATDTNPATGTTFTFTDSPPAKNGSITYTYRYTVRAEQCPDTSTSPASYMASGESPVLWFPCAFSGSGLDVQVTLTLEGDGMTPASAWLTNNPASSVVVSGTGLVSAQAFLKTGSLVIDLGTQTGTAPYSFPLIEAEVGELYELTVVARDANGCAATMTRYIEEGTATGCCLAAYVNDTNVVRYAPGQTFVDIAFKNLCAQDLSISSVELKWDPAIAGNSSATTLTNIEFPSTGTGTAVRVLTDTAATGATSIRTITTSPPTSASPPASTTILSESETYVIRVNFNKILTNANSPITSFCVIYTRPSVDLSSQNCKIVPQPTTLFSCN